MAKKGKVEYNVDTFWQTPLLNGKERKINGKNLQIYFTLLYKEKFHCSSPAFHTSHVVLLAKLIAEFGEEKALKFVEDVFKNWYKIKESIKVLNGNPTIPMLFGFRHSFLDVMTKNKNSVTYEKKTQNSRQPVKIQKDKSITITRSKVTKKLTPNELFLRW
jgi:hypothetical protein